MRFSPKTRRNKLQKKKNEQLVAKKSIAELDFKSIQLINVHKLFINTIGDFYNNKIRFKLYQEGKSRIANTAAVYKAQVLVPTNASFDLLLQ